MSVRPGPHARTGEPLLALCVHADTHFWAWGSPDSRWEVSYVGAGGDGKLTLFSGTLNFGLPPQPTCCYDFSEPHAAVPRATLTLPLCAR